MPERPASEKTHIVLVNAVVFKGDKVLISQRSMEEQHEPGKWTIPGGKAERGSAGQFNILEKTAKREVLEETGIVVGDRMRFVCDNSFIKADGQHTIALIFACEHKSGEPAALEDTMACIWEDPGALDRYDFAPNVRDYIAAAFALRGSGAQG